ncbi:MAG: hypothetical protein EAX90_03130 [Candidatus Heimdallarchaeota archaeon]|nr:hypothetical protein [Candidatus Heimdallarchaeota archaeon]
MGILADYGYIGGNGHLYLDNWTEVFVDAVELADPDIDFSVYENIIVILSDVWWRGWSTLGVKIHIDTDEGEFDVEGTVVAEQDTEPIEAVWGRIAHEMGHCFLLQHTHGSGGTKNYASYYSLMARAYPSACNIYTQLIDTHAGWFDASTNEVVIATGGGGTYHVRPRHLDVLGDIQALKIPISATKYYRVEVIEQKSEDAWLPDEGVLIYLVDEGQLDDRECTDIDSTDGSIAGDPDDLFDCLFDVGGSFTDIDNGISISIDDFALDGYDVTVTNTADGTPDLMINKWGNPPGSPGPYETIDIWIDSPVNGWNWYRHNDGNGANPTGNGDDPLLNHANRLHAKIHNIGDVVASGVTVKFYENRPIGAGASGTWVLIDTVDSLTINDGATLDVSVEWTPEYDVSPSDTGIMDMHSCVKVVIDDHILEDNTDNNWAQENIDFFEVLNTGGIAGAFTSEAYYFGPVSKEFTIVNPFKETKEIYVNVQDITTGWNVTGEGIGETHIFEANEAKVFSITITPGPNARFTDTMEANLVGATEVFDDVNQDFYGDIHLTPFGGVTVQATIMYRSSLTIDAVIRDQTTFTVTGHLEFLDDITSQAIPTKDGDLTVYIVMEETNTGVISDATVVVDEFGDFEVEVTGKTGVYSINAYYAGTSVIASSASATLIVDTNSSSIYTSTFPFPGFTYYITLGGIVFLCAIVVIVRKRK